MISEKLGDLTINGFGSSNGGDFNHVSLNGKATVNGSVTCSSFDCNGAGNVSGDIKAENARVNGNAKVNGNVYCESLIIEGNMTIQGETFLSNMRVSGRSSIGGNLKGQDLKIQGRAIIGGSCEVENFKAEGQFEIGDLLSADHMDIHLHGESRAKEIGGQTIRVKNKKTSLIGLIKNLFPSKLEAELIEGDDIEVESTHARLIRGNNVIIGPDCVVDLVEYTGTYQESSNSKVKESKKI